MQVNPIKTHKITEKDTDILKILDQYLLEEPKETKEPKGTKGFIKERSIIAISSKIVAICEGRIVPASQTTKDELAEKEAQMYLPRTSNKYDVLVTITHGTFIASAGVDESNGNGYFILLPKDPQASANAIREYLVKKFGLKHVGVIITDSHNMPLQWGVTGVAIAHSGFSYLNSYIGKPDVFGRPLHVEQVNVADTLAAASVGVMGEGSEQTPLALITDVGFVQFQDHNPTQEELQKTHAPLEDDIFAGLLTSAHWKKR